MAFWISAMIPGEERPIWSPSSASPVAARHSTARSRLVIIVHFLRAWYESARDRWWFVWVGGCSNKQGKLSKRLVRVRWGRASWPANNPCSVFCRFAGPGSLLIIEPSNDVTPLFNVWHATATIIVGFQREFKLQSESQMWHASLLF